MTENFQKLMTNTKLQDRKLRKYQTECKKNLHVGMSYQKCQQKSDHEKNGQFYTGKDVQNH